MIEVGSARIGGLMKANRLHSKGHTRTHSNVLNYGFSGFNSAKNAKGTRTPQQTQSFKVIVRPGDAESDRHPR